MTVDGFTYLGVSRFGWSVSLRELQDALDEAEVGAAVACPCQPFDHDLERANEELAEAVRAAPSRLVGLARIDPLRGDVALEQLRRASAELGLRGLFLHPWEDSFELNSPAVNALVAVAASLGAPVMVACGYPWVAEAAQLSRLAENFPEVTFLATNGAQINISGLGQVDAENLVDRCENVILVSNGVYRDDFLDRLVRKHGGSRLVFGSSFPLMDLVYERRRIEWSRLPDDARGQVLGGTLRALYGLDTASIETPADQGDAR
jgi:predicted TIM-barrel fold metal-dependent hydrolase